MITTEKLSETTKFHVETPREGGGVYCSNVTADYETARAWAHQPGARVVMVVTTAFVCEDGDFIEHLVEAQIAKRDAKEVERYNGPGENDG